MTEEKLSTEDLVKLYVEQRFERLQIMPKTLMAFLGAYLIVTAAYLLSGLAPLIQRMIKQYTDAESQPA
jgi:hypothetical protein